MNINHQILFFFSALGVFNGLVISIYFFFFKKPKSVSNYFFAFLLLMLVMRVGKSIFFYFNPNLSKNILQTGLTACLFIGPSLYFYLKSLINPKRNNYKNWKFHFVVLFSLAIIIGYLYPYKEFSDLWNSVVIKTIYWIWFFYVILSGLLIKETIRNLFNKKYKINPLEFWLLSVYFGNLIIWIAYNTVKYTSYIVGALTFTFILYLLFLLIHYKKRKEAIFSTTEKYLDKKISPSKIETLSNQLKKIMLDEKPYKNSNIKLSDIAQKLNVSSHLFSQLLNDNLDKNFAKFISEYRINEAKELLSKNDKFTLEAIGFEAGFSSKSTFYAMFKKMVGITPAQYKATFKV